MNQAANVQIFLSLMGAMALKTEQAPPGTLEARSEPRRERGGGAGEKGRGEVARPAGCVQSLPRSVALLAMGVAWLRAR